MSTSTYEDGQELVFCRYIVRNGKKIYPKNGKVFCFPVDKVA